MENALLALRHALEFQRELGGRYVPHIAPRAAAFSSSALPEPDDMATTDLFGNAAPTASDDPYERIEALIPDGHPVKKARRSTNSRPSSPRTSSSPSTVTASNPSSAQATHTRACS